MRKIINKKVYWKKILTHLKRHHKKYLFSTFWGFALVKMFILFLWLTPITNIGNIFANNNESIVLNSGNLNTYCTISEDWKEIVCNPRDTLDIIWIQPWTFENYKNSIETIVLSGNKITDIEPWTFNGLEQLKKVFLNDNQIFNISPDAFDRNSNIHLHTDNNCLSRDKLWALTRIVSIESNTQKLCLHVNYQPKENEWTIWPVQARLTLTGDDILLTHYIITNEPLEFSDNGTQYFDVRNLQREANIWLSDTQTDTQTDMQSNVQSDILNYPEDGRQFPATVTRIDNTPPVCGEWSYFPSLDTRSTQITATLSWSYDTGIWSLDPLRSWWTCTITENDRPCLVQIKDALWNTRDCISSSTNHIDREQPTITFDSYSWNGSYFSIKVTANDNAELQDPSVIKYRWQTWWNECEFNNVSTSTLTNNTYTYINLDNNYSDDTYYLCIQRNSLFDKAWNGNEETQAGPFVLDNTAPTLEQLAAIPQQTNNTTPNYTFNSTEAGTITYWWNCTSSTTGAVAGNNTITFNTLQPWTYSNCTIMVTDTFWNESNTLTIPEFTIQIGIPTCTPTYNPAETEWWTNGNVIVTLDCSTWVTITNNGWNNTHEFTNNWEYTFTYKDEENNGWEIVTRVTWIDKDEPTLHWTTTIWTTWNRTPSYTFTSTEPGNITYNWSCNGDITQAISWENTTIFNELEYWTYSDCSITITDNAWNTNTLIIPSFTIAEHGSPTALIGWWAHTVPSMRKQDITVEIIRYQWAEWGVAILNTNNPGSTGRHLWYTPITTWHYTMYIDNEDKNWKYVCAFGETWWNRETICSVNPIKIDTHLPTLQLISPSNWANNFASWDTITLQWSWHDEPSWISGYTLTIDTPDNNTETYYYNSWTTSTTYTVNKPGTWTRTIKATDIVWRSVQDTRTFVVKSTWWNNWTWFTLISPALWDQISLWNNVVLSRQAWTTNNGYIREISSISWTFIASWYTTSLTTTVNSELFTTWAYSWSVQDIASETTKTIPLFYIVDSQNTPTLKVRQFEFDEIKNADIDEYYKSNSITIKWLSSDWYSFAYLQSGVWALFINDRFVWTQWYVENWDKIYIEMWSSSEYNQTTKTTLIVWWGANTISGDFKITTRGWINGRDDTDLSPMQKLWGIVFVDSLVEMYQYDEEKLATFLSTFMQVLQDKSDYYAKEIQKAEEDWDDELAQEYKLYKDAIDFLYITVKHRYNNIEVEDRTVYIAPNGKQYLVEYDEDRMAYTSPDFVRAKYFPTRELFTNHIDLNNPKTWSWGIIGNVITTHNGKVYTIYETNWKWTSSNFRTAKYFDTKEDIINHILANNPASDWNHTIDTDFDEVKYTAPNGKVYKIFKTSNKWNNPNMYSSYNFVNAKYFTNLEAAKKFIDQNNKK